MEEVRLNVRLDDGIKGEITRIFRDTVLAKVIDSLCEEVGVSIGYSAIGDIESYLKGKSCYALRVGKTCVLLDLRFVVSEDPKTVKLPEWAPSAELRGKTPYRIETILQILSCSSLGA